MKTKLDKQLKTQLEELHRSDYGAGGWGAATSTPYRVKTYLTRAQSDRIRAAYDALRAKVSAKLAGVPKSKQEHREHGFEFAEYLFDGDGGRELNYTGENLKGWRVQARTLNHITFKNGRGHYQVRPYDPNDVGVQSIVNCTGYPSYSRIMRLQVYWDAERELYYVLEWERASTGPIPEEKRRRKWCRGAKEREFLGECRNLRDRLLEAGVEIKGIVRNGGRWHDEVYVDCAAPDATVDLSGRDAGPAWNCHPAIQAKAPAEAKGGLGVPPAPVEPAAVPDAGMTVCFTGALSVTRLEATNAAKAAGLGVKSSVTKGLTYLVTNTPFSGSSKNRAAQALGVKVIDEKEFARLCEELKGPRENAAAPEPEPVHALPPPPAPEPAWFMK